MKLNSKLALFLGVLSFSVISSEHISPLENVNVFKTELSNLSIQNISSENIEVDLYGETFDLAPASGLRFECAGYKIIELQIKKNDHDFFEVPCNSRIVFTESFNNQFVTGE